MIIAEAKGYEIEEIVAAIAIGRENVGEKYFTGIYMDCEERAVVVDAAFVAGIVGYKGDGVGAWIEENMGGVHGCVIPSVAVIPDVWGAVDAAVFEVYNQGSAACERLSGEVGKGV